MTVNRKVIVNFKSREVIYGEFQLNTLVNVVVGS